MAEGEGRVDLADAVIGLRKQLLRVVEEGAAENLQFGLEPIELQLQAVLTRSGEAGLSWQILTAGVTAASTATQTVTVRLRPVWKKADGTKVTDFTIVDVVAAEQGRPRVGPQPSSKE